MATIEINGVDPSTYGFAARDPGTLLGSPPMDFTAVDAPARPGAKVGLRQTGVRAFQVQGILESTSLASAQTNTDSLMALCLRQQPSTVIFAWSTSRRLSVECRGVEVRPLGPAFGVFKYAVTLDFSAPDPPFWQGATEHSVGSIGSTGELLPMGNAPVFLRVSIKGPATNPKATLYNSTGGAVEALKFTCALDSSQYLNIDLDLQTAYMSTAAAFSTGTDEIPNWLSTEGDFFSVLPQHYNAQSSSWPMLAVSTGTATVTYRKAWY